MNETTTVEMTDTEAPHYLSEDEYPLHLVLSEKLRRFVDLIGRFGSWFMLPLILITVFDLGLRKTGEVQIWLFENISMFFGSTLLQELEWHSHTVCSRWCLVTAISGTPTCASTLCGKP